MTVSGSDHRGTPRTWRRVGSVGSGCSSGSLDPVSRLSLDSVSTVLALAPKPVSWAPTFSASPEITVRHCRYWTPSAASRQVTRNRGIVRVMTDVWTMSEAAGTSARSIRQAAGATLAEVAKAAKAVGLPWSSGRVGDFESGRIAPSLPTLLAVAGALSEIAQERHIGLADLFAVDGLVRINDRLVLMPPGCAIS